MREQPLNTEPLCAKVEVAVSPASIRGGDERATVLVTVSNCGAEPILLHASESCTRFGFHPMLVRGEEQWHLWRGESALRRSPDPTTCGVVPTSVRLQTGQQVGDEFYWDGTTAREDCEDCRPIRMPAATYDVVVRVDVEEIAAPQLGHAEVTLVER